jgi:hypothetical protein
VNIARHAVISAVLAVTAQGTFASDAPELTEGSRIRLTVLAEAAAPKSGRERRVTGTLAALDEKVLKLNGGANRQLLTLERTAVTRIELSRGRNTWRAAGLGCVGAVAGLGAAIVALLTIHECWNECETGGGDYLLALPIIGLAGGVALGRRERWQTVTPTGRMGWQPAPPGPADSSRQFSVALAGKAGLRLAPVAGGLSVSIGVHF